METHWLPTILSPVAFQCALRSKFQAHWIATGLPLNYHWLRVRAGPLDCHWITTELPLALGKGLFQDILRVIKQWQANVTAQVLPHWLINHIGDGVRYNVKVFFPLGDITIWIPLSGLWSKYVGLNALLIWPSSIPFESFNSSNFLL